MAAEPIKLLSSPVVEKLAASIPANIDRYASSDFSDLARENGWAIETKIATWDNSIVSQLNPSVTPEAEVANSLLIYNGLHGMTPALAREERLWVRLCHVEFLDFARARWLTGATNVEQQARLHFFAKGLTGCRDENAIGRLWWNGHVATLAMPDNPQEGLRRLLRRANNRLQIVDRADTAFRQPLVAGILRLLGSDSWFDTYDAAIADFMLEVNKRSGSVVFEAFDDSSVDAHLSHCLTFAKQRRSNAGASQAVAA